MALEPITNSSTVSSGTVQSGKSVSSQSTQQQDFNSESQSTGVNQAQDLAAVYNARNSNLPDDSQNKTNNNGQWIKNAVTDANNKIKLSRTRCEFSYNDEVNRVAIKVVDSETDEVIKEIPPEETLKVIEKIWEIAGLVVDERR